MKKTNSAGGVVLNKKGEVLLVSQHETSWSLPKGHIEKNENALGAAKREIYEESGITDLKFIKNLGSYRRYRISKENLDDKSELKTINIFLFKTDQKKIKPVDRENPKARWVDKKDVANLLTHKKDKKFFLRILKHI
ncbi:NUDIX hydrolase [Candidatus Woesearchaeota archaeon]|nr:NUDIX hydrolase [Candidatus Woesearchaeota archaeon]